MTETNIMDLKQMKPTEVDRGKISIIIPTLNEAENLKTLLPYLIKHSNNQVVEILVADADSEDDTEGICQKHGAIFIPCQRKSRAFQMNKAAHQAEGEILYFLHADSLPPDSFVDDIKESLKLGFGFGCYPFEFDKDHPLLKINAYCTKFDRLWVRGGDQSMFISRQNFLALDGFKEDYLIMEEYEFIKRARKQLSFRIMEKRIRVSARKYEENSYLRVNLANLTAFILFSIGASQKTLRNTYTRMIKHPKA